ncbi:MAG: hypothetical protein LIP01_04670 [Tannerellaceae bacterium]|nr:hypothetical protein [Tannerellaceae bacterium]
MADLVVAIIGFFVKFMFVCLSIVFVPVMVILLFVFVMVFGSVMVGGTTVLFRIMPAIDWSYFSALPKGTLLIFSFCSILVVGIPLIAGIYSIFSYFFKYKPVGSSVKWTLILIWTIALLVTIIIGVVFGTPWLEMLQDTGVTRLNS